MKNHFFIFLLLCYLLVFFLLLFSVDTSYVLQTPEGQVQQAVTWSGMSKTRIFLTLQVLFGSLLLSFLGFLGMLVLWDISRYLWLAGVLGFLVYFRLDPRYVPGEAVYLFRGVVMALLGALTDRAFFRFSENRQRKVLLDALILVAAYCLSLILARIVTHAPADQLLTFSLPHLCVTILLFLSGVIGHAALLGSAKELFDESRKTRILRRSFARKYIIYSFGLAVGLLMVITFAALELPVAQRIGWTLFSPFVPLFMSFYSPFTWFTSSGGNSLFGGDVLGASGMMAGTARVFLGMFFQYLSLLTICAIVLAIRRVRSVPLLLMAHLLLILYWLPTLWFAEKLSIVYR